MKVDFAKSSWFLCLGLPNQSILVSFRLKMATKGHTFASPVQIVQIDGLVIIYLLWVLYVMFH